MGLPVGFYLPSCASCNAFNSSAKTCHADPPVFISPGTAVAKYAFPAVDPDDWCRRYTQGTGALNPVPSLTTILKND